MMSLFTDACNPVRLFRLAAATAACGVSAHAQAFPTADSGYDLDDIFDMFAHTLLLIMLT